MSDDSNDTDDTTPDRATHTEDRPPAFVRFVGMVFMVVALYVYGLYKGVVLALSWVWRQIKRAVTWGA